MRELPGLRLPLLEVRVHRFPSMWLRLPGATAIVVAAAFAALAQPAPDTSPVVSLTVLNPTQPVAGDGSTGEVAYVPDTAGPSSAILATYDDSTQSSARKQLFVEIDDTHGHALFFRAQTDTAHRLLFAPVNGAARVTLFKSFTRDRKPDAAAVQCEIGSREPVATTPAVANVPRTGPAIVEAATSYERGGISQGLVNLQTRDLDPSRARLLVDDSAQLVTTLAASDINLKGRLADDIKLGSHVFSVRSGSSTTNRIRADVVALRADPVAPAQPGALETLTVHVNGLPADHTATLSFSAGGAVQLASGDPTTTVSVHDGVAQIAIRAVHPGSASIGYQLNVTLPQIVEVTPPPTPSPTPSPSPSPTPTRTPSPSPSPTPTPRPTPTPTPTPRPTPIPTPRPSPTPTALPTPSPRPFSTPTPLPTPRPSPAPTTRPAAAAFTPASSPIPTRVPVQTPKPTATASRTPTPSPSPSAAVSSSAATKCAYYASDGWFEPKQTAYQDDPATGDAAGKQLSRTDSPALDHPVFTAELPMIAGRAALVVGVDHYEYRGQKVEIPANLKRDYLVVKIRTNCTEKVKARLRVSGGAGITPNPIYSSLSSAELPLTGKPLALARDKWPEYSIEYYLGSHGWPSYDVLKFNQAGRYALTAELYDESGNQFTPRLRVEVDGTVVAPPG